jgi:glycosyltransferase involved in cell wall biosynthesis
MSRGIQISVIMSVYNGEEYLTEAIDSVLAQSFRDFELIVINDCSTDRTGEILARYAALDARIKVHTNEVNLRLPSSLNKAISLAEGKYIARMDADDICLPDRLEKQYAFMEANSEVALSSCRFMTLKNGVISSGGCGGKTDHESIKAMLLVTNPILHPGIIAKAEVIRELGYDPNFTCTEDMELWSRFVMSQQRIEILSEYLMIYRLHDKQITQTTSERQRREVVAVQKRYYGALLEEMSPDMEEFYINGIYFRDRADVRQFCTFFQWLKKTNRKQGKIEKEALYYAMFEILAEYKRKGLSKAKIVKAMLNFGVPFLMKEIPARKQRAVSDGCKCIDSAAHIGLQQSGGSPEFPIFSQK